MRVTLSTIIERLGRPGPAAALLVGAGMSVEAGIPMAKKDVPQIKSVATQIAEHIFFRNKKRLPNDQIELEAWLAECGLLQNDATRYSDSLQLIAKDPAGRQRYLEQFFVGRRPTASHEIIARFVARGYFRQTFTTNFDPLLERAMLYAGLDVAVAGDAELVNKLAAGPAPVVYKVHGDYLMTNHKHTIEETTALERAMHDRLVDVVLKRSILVIGHSGSDKSIMDALAEGLAGSATSEVLWVLYGNDVPSPLLAELQRRFNKRVLIASTPGYLEFWETAARRVLDRAPLTRHDPRIAASYFVGRTEVTVLVGDITEVGAEAIVASDDARLSHSGGVSEAIFHGAGPALERDLEQFWPRLPLSPGDVVATGPGLLADRGVRYIFHAVVTPDWKVPAKAEATRTATRRILDEAECRELRTLAIPALGGGQGGLPPEDVASAMVGAVLEHLHNGSGLRQVVFVLYTPMALEAFKNGQMDAIAHQQEQELREALANLDPDLVELSEAVMADQDWGLANPMAAQTWLRELVARQPSIAGEAVRYCHARWHTHLCRLLASAADKPGKQEQIAFWQRQVQALEISYAPVFH
ncbi:MAG: macro domain-containing protein [Bacillota bacterium]